jgi:hypothetical protein
MFGESERVVVAEGVEKNGKIKGERSRALRCAVSFSKM